MGDQLEFPFRKSKLGPGLLRLIWRNKVATLCGSGGAFIALVFAQNLINAEIACSINFAQPTISDVCGYFGLGDKPQRKERLAWDSIEQRLSEPSTENCAVLQAHIRRFPKGAHRATADQLLASAIVQNVVSWVPETRTLPLFEPIPESGFATRLEAEADVADRAERRAARQCGGYTQSGVWRLQSSSTIDDVLNCQISGDAHFCSMEGTTVCELERRVVDEIKQCGTEVAE